jgi:uncharacterized membrane protein YphA (DoxX/SURF4 family)
MKDKILLGAQVLLGVIFVVFGLNFFLHFIPVPPPNEAAGAFLGALFNTGYMFPWIKVTEIICGLALLTGLFAPLALVILAPIVLNIAGVHFILDPGGAPIAAVCVVLSVLVAIRHKQAYAALLRAK